ncbi:zinc ABC transporter substrate-binding protein, partial [uncultured Bifidobacterium sp.]|uniref:metal ABC transporter solute-binding protein, Zn/Mn family n=1 Tax=uncultured Bifidobacterium sp. TaxID=165187 RepID=UPI002605ECF4
MERRRMLRGWSWARRAGAAIASVFVAMGMAACSWQGASSNADGGTISVVASINQWGSLAKELGGTYVSVTSVMSNTSVEAHDYEPTTQNIAA